MSRSRRKSPFMGITTARSEKQDKKFYHKAERAAVRQAIYHEKEIMPHKNEIADVWTWAKDGKQRIHPQSKWMRK